MCGTPLVLLASLFLGGTIDSLKNKKKVEISRLGWKLPLFPPAPKSRKTVNISKDLHLLNKILEPCQQVFLFIFTPISYRV